MNRLVQFIAAVLCAGMLGSCADVIPDGVDSANSKTVSACAEEAAGADTKPQNNEILTIDDLMLMTGEEIRVAYIHGEVW